MQRSQLTIIGLGPGDAGLLTLEARDALAAAPEVWLRTARHPAVAGLPVGPRYESFDKVYERGASFDEVYQEIATSVALLAVRPQGVVYAVPGHPLYGEATVLRLLELVRAQGIEPRIVAGMSFVDAVSPVVGLDPLARGLLLLDALSVDARGRGLAPERPTLIAQVYDVRAASQVKLSLLERYPPEHAVRVISAAGTADERVVDTVVSRLDREPDAFDHLTSIYVAPLAEFADVRAFEGLRRIVAQLRSPNGGCPWDLEQTHETLKRYLLEEAYEALDALDEGDPHRLAEELGDLMMQILLHAQVAEDSGDFAIEDVIEAIATKLVRRHPHVFGDVAVEGAEEVLRNWEVLKQQERGDAPLLDAVPKALPALAQAQSVQGRALKAGFSSEVDPVGALRQEGVHADSMDAARLGEMLFALAALARERGIDAEDALRRTIRSFRADVGRREAARRREMPLPDQQNDEQHHE